MFKIILFFSGLLNSQIAVSQQDHRPLELAYLQSDDFKNFRVVHSGQVKANDHRIESYEAVDALGSSYRIWLYDTSDRSAANGLLKEKIQNFLSTYSNFREPYFASVTKSIECRSEFKPMRLEGESSDGPREQYLAYATLRNIIGGCNSDLFKKISAVYFIQCGKRIFHLAKILDQKVVDIYASGKALKSPGQFKNNFPTLDAFQCIK